MSGHAVTPVCLPCPFCGSIFIKLNTIRDGATMACHDCMAQGPAKFSPNARENSRDSWNTRTNSHAALVKALERIRGGHFKGAGTLAVNGDWKAIVENLQAIARQALSVTSPDTAERRG